MTWRYLRIGTCDYCADESARLHTPVVSNLRTVTPPAFCPRCRLRFEQLLVEREPAEALAHMPREKSHGDR